MFTSDSCRPNHSQITHVIPQLTLKLKLPPFTRIRMSFNQSRYHPLPHGARVPLSQSSQHPNIAGITDNPHHLYANHQVPFGNTVSTALRTYDTYLARKNEPFFVDYKVPFGNPKSTSLITAPTSATQLSAEARSTLNASVRDSTLVRKHNYVQKFLNWSAGEKLTPSDVLPANETTLCNYAATFAGRTAGGTARAHISAIKSWTLHKGHHWLGGERLNSVLNGVERRAPPSSFRPPRAPVKESHLFHLHTDLNLDGNNGKDAAIAAAADLMFFGQLRAGEVLPDSSITSLYDSCKHPRVSDLGPVNSQGTCSLFLPSTKTSRNRGESASITQQDSQACPIKAMRDHIRINELKPGDPLLAYRDSSGSLRCLTRAECINRCNEIWSPRGIPKISGHCFRIGGTTHYLCRGVPPDVVKALGRWKSDAFLVYWRDLDTLASLHLHRHHAQELYHSRLYVDHL